jgi:hypothetical protein
MDFKAREEWYFKESKQSMEVQLLELWPRK